MSEELFVVRFKIVPTFCDATNQMYAVLFSGVVYSNIEVSFDLQVL